MRFHRPLRKKNPVLETKSIQGNTPQKPNATNKWARQKKNHWVPGLVNETKSQGNSRSKMTESRSSMWGPKGLSKQKQEDIKGARPVARKL